MERERLFPYYYKMASRILALGDSITYGYPYGHNYSWVNLVSEKLGLSISNLGINGDTLWDMEKRLLIDVVDANPDCVLILGGTNDVFQGVRLDQMKHRLTLILERLKENQISVILGLPIPIQDKEMEKQLASFRSFVRTQARKEKIPLINFHDAFLDSRKRIIRGLIEDGVHPSPQGYRLMGEVAEKALKKIFKNSPEKS